MKLYYNPYACSLAVLIAAQEASIDLDLIQVDIMKDPHTLVDGSDYLDVNAKNYVPALVIANGELLTEVAVICGTSPTCSPRPGLRQRRAAGLASGCRKR